MIAHVFIIAGVTDSVFWDIQYVHKGMVDTWLAINAFIRFAVKSGVFFFAKLKRLFLHVSQVYSDAIYCVTQDQWITLWYKMWVQTVMLIKIFNPFVLFLFMIHKVRKISVSYMFISLPL